MPRVQDLTSAIAVLFLVAATVYADQAAIARQLAAECDVLVATAIRKPYGWGWAAQPVPDPNSHRGKDVPIVDFDPLATPAAGLLLHWAGQELNNPDYQEAARQVARGIVASQQSNGRIPSRAAFGPVAASRDPSASIWDRRATCASLGLLLTLLDDGHHDEYLRRGAARATLWLTRQQTPGGAWPVACLIDNLRNPNAPPHRVNLIRLDQSGYRDSTLAIIYAQSVLQDANARRAQRRAIDQLLRLRAGQSKTTSGVWQGVYELSGTPSTKLPKQTSAIDMLACRYALQTLLAADLVLGDPTAAEALEIVAPSVSSLRYEDGLWRRLYPFEGDDLPTIKPGPAPTPLDLSSAFRPTTNGPDLNATGTFGLTAVLATAQQIGDRGRPAVQASLSTHYTPRQDLARTLTGLTDEPMALNPLAEPTQPIPHLSTPNSDAFPAGTSTGRYYPHRLHSTGELLTHLRLQRSTKQTQP